MNWSQDKAPKTIEVRTDTCQNYDLISSKETFDWAQKVSNDQKNIPITLDFGEIMT